MNSSNVDADIKLAIQLIRELRSKSIQLSNTFNKLQVDSKNLAKNYEKRRTNAEYEVYSELERIWIETARVSKALPQTSL